MLRQMSKRASLFKLSCPKVLRKYVFNRRSVEKDLSLVHVVTGKVARIFNKL